MGWASLMMVRRTRRRADGPTICLAIVLAAGLWGCNGPIEAGRALTGMNKNDPDPATAPFTGNLEKADTGGYGNLASVPPIPAVATTLAERKKLTDTLTGERVSTEANDAKGNPGSPASGPVPPAPPVPPSIAAPEMAALPPTPKPETPIPPMRKMDEPPEPQPADTAMQTPQIGNAPGVEPPHPAPGQGHPSPMPRPAPSALPAETVQSGNPQPTPPQVTLPEAKPEPKVAAMPPPKLPPSALTVAALDLPAGPTDLRDADQARLAEVVAQYQEKPRAVRVVAYAQPGVGGAEELNAFRAALDHADAIAKELTVDGIPAKQIQTEAAPASPAAPPGRVEVQLLQ
jgi:hypothetical protein